MTLSVPSPQAIRVLVVDDSAFMRFTITKHLSADPAIHVLGTASDGLEALELIPKLKPDVVTLDVEMPRLDGLSTLRKIMSTYPLPVIMLSSLTKEGTVETVQALTLGAVDFVAKPSNKANVVSVMDEVIKKIKRAAQTRVWSVYQRQTPLAAAPADVRKGSTRTLNRQDPIVIIGTSTGGPRALNTIMPVLSPRLQAAYVIIQHMPAGFTRSLAERLDGISPLTIREAAPEDQLEIGKCLLAPGGFHMVFDTEQKVTLNQNPPVHGVRPAIDVTIASIVNHFPNKIVGVILTGMGSDGTNGAGLIHAAGGTVIAEAEETSIVWGMPRSVYEAGFADELVPLPDIPKAIERAITKVA